MDSTLLKPAAETPLEPRRARRHEKNKRGRVKLIIIAAVLGSILLGVGAGFFWLRSVGQKILLEPEEREKVAKVVKPHTGNIVNALLIGTDQRPGWDSARADTIVFIRANKSTGQVYMVSIPRDTRVEIPERGLDKINHAWAFGKAPLMIETVSDFLGLPINFVFQVDFAQFESAVDALGGVDFETAGSWTDGELGVSVRSGTHRRYGKEALAIIRNRSWGPGKSGSDLTRVGIQQEFIKATIAQSITSYTDVPRAANVVASYVNTNMGLTQMLGVGRSFAGAELDMQSTTLKGTPQTISGVSYVIHDEEAKEELIRTMLDNEPLPEE